MITWSEKNDKIAPAFVKAQAACSSAKKDSENAAFKQGGKVSKYADLTAVWAACEEALEQHSLGILQMFGEVTDGKMHMTTMLVHESGQWLQKEGSIPLPKQDPQGLGSATTYFRRYSIAALMGIVQEDDDGNAASALSRAPANANANSGPTITPQQFDEISKLADEVGADPVGFCTYFKIPAVAQLPAAQFDAAKKLLEKKRAAPQQKAA